MEQNTPIALEDVFSEIVKQDLRISKNLIGRLLRNWQIESRSREGNRRLHPHALIDVIQGFIEYGVSADVKRPKADIIA